MLNEKEIKALTLEKLINAGKININSLVLSELSLAKKARRIDLAYISEREMVAIEIKSERDTLLRLPGQIQEYKKYFDRVIVVAAAKFIPEITKKSDDEIEVWELHGEKIKTAKRGRKINKHYKESYISLMTKREINILANMADLNTKNLPMYEMKKIVLENSHRISTTKVKDVLIEGLKRKHELPSHKFLMKSIENKRVSIEDLCWLSPYHVGKPY